MIPYSIYLGKPLMLSMSAIQVTIFKLLLICMNPNLCEINQQEFSLIEIYAF